MSKVDHPLKIDRELLRQLEEADTCLGSVPVVFGLRMMRPGQRFLSAAETEEMTRQVLERVNKETGLAPSDWNIFKNLGAFVVSAPVPFIRKLLEQEEIASATANRQSSNLLIPPRGKRPVY